jgi:hypothetical protein
MLRKIIKFFFLIAIVSFFACTADVPDNMKPKPSALGKINEIVVVSDDMLWDGQVGDSLRYYFESPFPVLPRPEPSFDLRHFNMEQMRAEPLRKQLRTYLVVGVLDDKTSPTSQFIRSDLKDERINMAYTDENLRTSVGTSKWATGQIVVYLFAPTEEKLLSSIGSYYPSIAKRVNLHDSKSLEAAVYAKGENKGLTQKILDNFGLNLNVPLDFVEAKYNAQDNFIWLRKEAKQATISLVIQKIEYKDQSQFSLDYVKALRDTYGKKYISSTTEGSYMVTNSDDLPMFEYAKENAAFYSKEYRGIWEMTKDFMGGPFISYMIHNAEDNVIYFCDGLVFGPGSKKRNQIQQLDLILRNARP